MDLCKDKGAKSKGGVNMSATLSYRPVKPPSYKALSGGQLKYIFIEKFDLNNGPHILKATDMEYLTGMYDAGDKELKGEVQAVMNAIGKYGEIEIFLTY